MEYFAHHLDLTSIFPSAKVPCTASINQVSDLMSRLEEVSQAIEANYITYIHFGCLVVQRRSSQ